MPPAYSGPGRSSIIALMLHIAIHWNDLTRSQALCPSRLSCPSPASLLLHSWRIATFPALTFLSFMLSFCTLNVSFLYSA